MSILTVITIFALFGMLLTPIIYGVIRFQKNLLGDEGYLSFTLPVTAAQHLWAKLLTFCVWEIGTVIVTFLCGVLFFLTVDANEVGWLFEVIGNFFSAFYKNASGWAIVLPILLLAALLEQFAANMLALYNAMSIGQTAEKHKVLASVGVYLGFNVGVSVVFQVVGTGLLVLFGEKWYMSLNTIMDSVTSGQQAAEYAFWSLCGILLLALVINGLLSLMYFLLSRHFLTKKLNLA